MSNPIESNPATDIHPLTEVPVAAGILQATAELLQQLADFLNANTRARTQLGSFLARHPLAEEEMFTRDPYILGMLALCELTEAAELLRELAAYAPGPHPLKRQRELYHPPATESRHRNDS